MSKNLVLRPVRRDCRCPSDAIYDWYSGVEFLSEDGEWYYDVTDVHQLIALGYTKIVILCGPQAAKISLPANPPSLASQISVSRDAGGARLIYWTEEKAP